MVKSKITREEILRMHRKASREEEIARYGHPVGRKRIHKSKKHYNRQQSKKLSSREDSFLLYGPSVFRKEPLFLQMHTR